MKNNDSLNRNFRHVWSDATQSWHVAPETARGAGKRAGSGRSACAVMGGVLTSVAIAAIATLSHAQQAPPVNQLPTGGSVVRGAATIGQTNIANNAVMNINQTTQRAAINWDTLNVGASASVNFNQPNSSAVTLNRVNDVNASQIYGRINAPGQVFLSNPNGVYFSPSAQVDVGALVATTHSISDDNFMAGNYRFERNGSTGKVINEGQLNAALGGYIALLAPEVQNAGVVVAQAGTVAMAAGEVVTLNFDGNQHLAGITTTAATLETLIENRQA
ncbi:MAG: filamentous hemagglutinin N-terminal domain-containing protein, partial [Rhodoferax sp.]|nr:filamentous hemagglutinin N-terminal domain-containing protein [Rhodoferax sp.]